MNQPLEMKSRSALIDLIGRSHNPAFDPSIIYPCLSVCIRGSKELSDPAK